MSAFPAKKLKKLVKLGSVCFSKSFSIAIKFTIFSIVGLVILPIFTHKVQAAPFCITDMYEGIYVTIPGAHPWVNVWIGGASGPYKVYMKFPGSDPKSSPGMQNWNQNFTCEGSDPNSSPTKCIGGATYDKVGGYTVSIAIEDSNGFQECGSITHDICSYASPVGFTLTYYNATEEQKATLSPPEMLSKTLSFGNEYICGVEARVGYIMRNGWGTFSLLPSFFSRTLDTNYKSFCLGYSCGYSDIYLSPVSFRAYGGAPTKQATFSIGGFNLINPYPTYPYSVSVSVSDIKLYHRPTWDGGDGSCYPQAICGKVEYQAADGTWSPDNFTVVPGDTVNLRCAEPYNTIEKWSWAAWLPSQRTNYYLPSWSGTGSPLALDYDISENNWTGWQRHEAFRAPAPVGKATGWLFDKLSAKVSWQQGVTGFAAQIYGPDPSTTKLVGDDEYRYFAPRTSDNDEYISFDIGSGNLNEPSITTNSVYRMSLKYYYNGQGGTAWWYNSRGCNDWVTYDWTNCYLNVYEVYLRPNIQGSWTPSDKNSKTPTWFAPSGTEVSPGQVFTITAHPYNSSCFWGWGDTINATIADFGNFVVKYYLNTISDATRLNCGVDYTALVGAKTMTCTTETDGTSKNLKLALAAGSYTVVPTYNSQYVLDSWRFGGVTHQAADPLNFVLGGGGSDYIMDIVLVEKAGPWFQTRDGDIHAQNNIASEIPNGVTDKNLSVVGAGGIPGIISYAGTTASFENGFPSSDIDNHWLAKSSARRTNYGFYYELLGSPAYTTLPTNGYLDPTALSSDGAYAYNGDIASPSSVWNVGTKKLVILTTGKFLIRDKIQISSGGSLVVVAKSGIAVASTVSSTGAINNKLQGVFITDGPFISSVSSDYAFTPADSNEILVIDGSVIAQTFNLNRDFDANGGSATYKNNTDAVESFRYDPSLIVNSFAGLWERPYNWQEVAP